MSRHFQLWLRPLYNSTFNFRLICVVLFIGMYCPAIFSQSKVLDLLVDTESETVLVAEPDSVMLRLAEVEQALESSQLTEMNLRMEIEQMKLASFAADSIKLAAQKKVIDSLRVVTKGVPVVVEEDTLFYMYTNRGGFAPEERAAQLSEKILKIGKGFYINPDSVYVLSDEFFTDVMYNNQVIASFTDNDALWMNMSREELANHHKDIVISTLFKLQEEYSLTQRIKRISLFLLVLIIQFLLIRVTNLFYRKLKIRVHRIRNLKPITIRDYEFLSIVKQEKVIYVFLNMLRYLCIILQFVVSIPILFSIFPQTEDLAMTLFSYILTPVKHIGVSFVHYIPNLFTIAVIYFIIRYVIKGIGYLANEIANENLKITGFYPDWAKPTYNIIRFLLYVFMVALIYPHLPYSDSKIFQGMSVFVGIIVSFGSSSAIGNLIAGIIITYMRPFKLGDRIKMNDTIGNVIEKTPIVTRIITLKNEIITVPNSMIMNSQTMNLSESARTKGLIIPLEVTCSYSTPWKDVHQYLIEAAEATQGVQAEPHPFVLEKSFDDFYIVYEINAYINDADAMSRISTELRQNIQDKFNEVGISILSPHYYTKTN